MGTGQLTYDGTTYRLDGSMIADLVTRGVIVPDPLIGGQFELAPEHLIAEVEQVATFVGFQAGDDVRGEAQDEAARRLRALGLQYHRDGQGH